MLINIKKSVFVFWVLAFMLFSSQVYSEETAKEIKKPRLSEIADKLRKNCARVYISAGSVDGMMPESGTFTEDIQNERQTLIGGYWWDENYIIIEDPVIPDGFIRSIEVSTSQSDKVYPAVMAGKFVNFPAVLLQVLPDQNNELPKVSPIEFMPVPDKKDWGKLSIASYGLHNNSWSIEIGGGLGGYLRTDSGQESFKADNTGVIIDESGEVVGLAFHNRLTPEGNPFIWKSHDLQTSVFLDMAEYVRRQEKIRNDLAKLVFKVRFDLRVRIDDDQEAGGYWRGMSMDNIDEKTAEVNASGFLLEDNKLFVPVRMSAENIARIENIVIILANGKEIAAEFSGALKNFQAIMIKTQDNITRPENDMGFSFIAGNEKDKNSESDSFKNNEGNLFLRWKVDYSLGRRKEYIDYDRWVGMFRGYLGIPVIETKTNEDNASLAFDINGKLLAVGLVPRLPPSGDDLLVVSQPNAGFRPVRYISDILTSGSGIDFALKPEASESGQKLLDLGVEWQRLDANTARLFKAEKETRGGQIGMLVTYVYPGSDAEKVGIKTGDILLRISSDLRSEAVDLKPTREPGIMGPSFFNVEDMSPETIQRIIATMPPPWPSRENSLSSLITAIGEGREVALEFLREGEIKQERFTISKAALDFRSAPKIKSAYLGLTVKPITYEVQRFYQRPDNMGVIVARVEDGGRAAVAGIHNYLLITHIDGKPIVGIDDFREKMDTLGINADSHIELTVAGFGKTRLVKIGN